MISDVVVCPYCDFEGPEQVNSDVWEQKCTSCGNTYQVFVNYEPTFETYKCDKYYAICVDHLTDEKFWKEKQGEKEIYEGEELFLSGGYYTHGKTGMLIFSPDMSEVKKAEVWKLLKSKKIEHEESPLYNKKHSLKIIK